MKRILFSEEWDKLHPSRRLIGNLFTTARKHTPYKYKYYAGLLGEGVEISLCGRVLGMAKVINVWEGDVTDMDIDWWRRDTYAHYTWADIRALMRRFYKNDNLHMIFIELQWVEVVI